MMKWMYTMAISFNAIGMSYGDLGVVKNTCSTILLKFFLIIISFSVILSIYTNFYELHS